MNESDYISVLIGEIETKLKWNNIAMWTDIDYRKFSELIFEETNISISTQTFKRLFGKVKYKKIYSPQPATKDALAKFLEYEDWHDFINSKNKKKEKLFEITHFVKRIRFSKKTIIIVSFTAFVVVVGSLLINRIKETKTKFFAENLYGTTPHTVAFHYDLSKLNGNDFWIDFGEKEAEDSLSKEKLDKNRKLINHCFESPGLFNVKVFRGDKTLSTIKIHVYSNKWDSYYFNDDNFKLRKFIFPLENKVNDMQNDGLLHVAQKDLNEQGFNGNTVYYLEHLQYRKFGFAADSCTLEVRYRNGPDTGGISCYDVEFRIIGEKGIVSIMLVQEGCYRWSEVTVGDVHINGKYDNLMQLSVGMTAWHIMKIKLVDNKALFINGKDTIFSCPYKQPIGLIKGIRLLTKGSGTFDYVKLFNSQGTLKYEDNFDD